MAPHAGRIPSSLARNIGFRGTSSRGEMWMKAGLVLVVAALVASQGLRNYSDAELDAFVGEKKSVDELLACSQCKSNQCSPLTKAIMHDLPILISGTCTTCDSKDQQKAINFANKVKQNFREQHVQLQSIFLEAEGPIQCPSK